MENLSAMSRDAWLRRQGRAALRERICAHGGVLSEQQVADMLGITPDGVRKPQPVKLLNGLGIWSHSKWGQMKLY